MPTCRPVCSGAIFWQDGLFPGRLSRPTAGTAKPQCAPYSRTAGDILGLYPSRGYLQSPHTFGGKRQCHLPLERLQAWEQKEEDDDTGVRVPEAILIARSAQKLCSHPPLWVSRQSLTEGALRNMSAIATCVGRRRRSLLEPSLSR